MNVSRICCHDRCFMSSVHVVSIPSWACRCLSPQEWVQRLMKAGRHFGQLMRRCCVVVCRGAMGLPAKLARQGMPFSRCTARLSSHVATEPQVQESSMHAF